MKNIIAYILLFISLGAPLLVHAQAGDISGFNMPTPQTFKFEVGKTTTNSIKWRVKHNPLKITFKSLTSLPEGIGLDSSNGGITWTPSKKEKLARYTLEIEALVEQPTGSYPYLATIYIESVPDPKDPHAGIYDLKVECDKTLEAWRILNEAQAKDPETPFPHSSVPTDLYAWELIFKLYSNTTDFSDNRQFYADKFLNFFSKKISGPSGGQPIGAERSKYLVGHSKLIPEARFSEFKSEWTNAENPSKQFDLERYYFGLSPLGEMIVQISSEFQTLEANYEFIKSKLIGFRNNFGLSQENLYLVYLLSRPDFNALDFLMLGDDGTGQSEQMTKEIQQLASEILLQKTSASLACNNAKAKLQDIPISWEELGMVGYVAQGPWLPWINDYIVQSVGKSMYNNPGVWELAKIVPVFGTALSLVDSSITLYEGKTAHGESLDRRIAGAYLALDVVGGAFDVVGTSYSVAKYRQLGQRFKAIAKGAKTDDIAREALHDASIVLKNELRLAPKAHENIPFCNATPGLARLKNPTIEDSSNDLSTTASLKDLVSCTVNSLKNEAGEVIPSLSHSNRFYAETNAAINYGQLAKAKLGITLPPGTKDYWKAVIANLKRVSNDPKNIILSSSALAESYSTRRAYISEVVATELVNTKNFREKFNLFNLKFRPAGIIPTQPLSKKEIQLVNFRPKEVIIDDPVFVIMQKSRMGLEHSDKTGFLKDQRAASEVFLAPRISNDTITYLDDVPLLVTFDNHLGVTLADMNLGIEPIGYRIPGATWQKGAEAFDKIILVNAQRKINGKGPMIINLTNEKIVLSLGNHLTDAEKKFDIGYHAIKLDIPPNQCKHFDNPIVRDAYPETAAINDIIKGIN